MEKNEELYFRKIMTVVVLVLLLILAFILLRPILLSIIFAFILAFVFMPVYNLLVKVVKSKNLSAGIVCLLFILIIAIPLWFITPILIKQVVHFYLLSQQMDIIASMQNVFPSLAISPEIAISLENVVQSSISKSINSIATLFTMDRIVNFMFQSVVVIFTFFFVLRDKEQLMKYVRTLLPFSKDVENKLVQSSKGITASVLYGQVVIGILQGLIVGIGLFIFGVPNALLLTVLATLAGIIPILGPILVWVPVVIYLLIAGNPIPAIGVAIFGSIASTIDNFLRPIIVSKKTKVHTSLVLIGMIGGLLIFGVLGLILGPLILAYLMIFLELYRNKKSPGITTTLSNKKKK